MHDPFNSRSVLTTSNGTFIYYQLKQLERAGYAQIDRLPFSIRVWLESLLRQCNEKEITHQDVINLAGWLPNPEERVGIPYLPARVLMHDLTGVPALVDLAAMRSTMTRMGGNPLKINPLVPVDLVIDHSIQVDFFAKSDSLTRNAELEFWRNRERYEFLRWGQKAFTNFRVVPPATGIVHQLNLEFLSKVVVSTTGAGEGVVFPDTLVGTDSHTTMINGLGVLGWGVGGIEAEAVMLGQPIELLAPDVIGFKLDGQLAEGVTAMDLALTITQMLRKKGVVDKFVEFYGPGLENLSLPDRAAVANMAPEYGATIGFFPVDQETLNYLHLTGRPVELVELVEIYCKEQGLFRSASMPVPDFTDTLELDLSTVEACLAGPKRPHDRVPLRQVKRVFQSALVASKNDWGYELKDDDLAKKVAVGTDEGSTTITHGAVVIAAITSCINTSNPSMMICAGLLARNAIKRGLKTAPYIKTSLAPGSCAVTEYLHKTGLLEPLAILGFNIVGYGCTTCFGNSGLLPGEVVKAVTGSDLVTAAVISGNRNFEGRVHPYVKASFLASPPLVVAYALAGRVAIDLLSEPLGMDADGKPVYLREIWPSRTEIQKTIGAGITPELFRMKYQDVFAGNEMWNSIQVTDDQLYTWDVASTYIQEPPFFTDFSAEVHAIQNITGARVLAVLGDSITTDHISPAGSISADSPAGRYLVAHGVQPKDFNTYGSRRGNDQVMVRGTFANIHLKNRMLIGLEGGITIYQGRPGGTEPRMGIFDASSRYREDGVPLVILAGKEYGSGSSRDWAAKGTNLLGVKAVIAESYERIHRSNLVGMGVLPLQFKPGESVDSLGLTGREVLTITGLHNELQPRSEITVHAVRSDGSGFIFQVVARLDTPREVNYYRNGGILPTVLRRMLA